MHILAQNDDRTTEVTELSPEAEADLLNLEATVLPKIITYITTQAMQNGSPQARKSICLYLAQQLYVSALCEFASGDTWPKALGVVLAQLHFSPEQLKEMLHFIETMRGMGQEQDQTKN